MPLPTLGVPTPLLRPWGPVAELLVRLVLLKPNLAPRLMFMPARALHAVAFALQIAAEAGEPDESMASRLSLTHPRDLLSEALSEPEHYLFRRLERCTTPAWSLDQYRSLERILRSPVRSFLTEASEISPEKVEEAELLLRTDPLVWRARKAFRYSHRQQHFATTVDFLRSLGLLRDLADFPMGAGRKAIARRVRADLARARCAERPFPEAAGWTKVETVGDLWAIAERLENCIRPRFWGSSAYALGLISGREIFLHNRQNDAIAQLRHVVHDLWTVVQVAGVKNECVPAAVRAALDADLLAGGLLLLPTDPATALQSVLQCGSELDILVDDAEDDVAA